MNKTHLACSCEYASGSFCRRYSGVISTYTKTVEGKKKVSEATKILINWESNENMKLD